MERQREHTEEHEFNCNNEMCLTSGQKQAQGCLESHGVDDHVFDQWSKMGLACVWSAHLWTTIRLIVEIGYGGEVLHWVRTGNGEDAL